jgi:hypothetical protein
MTGIPVSRHPDGEAPAQRGEVHCPYSADAGELATHQVDTLHDRVSLRQADRDRSLQFDSHSYLVQGRNTKELYTRQMHVVRGYRRAVSIVGCRSLPVAYNFTRERGAM